MPADVFSMKKPLCVIGESAGLSLNAPQVSFMDTGPKTASGYDLEQEYDYIMQKAMNSYLEYRSEEKLGENINIRLTRPQTSMSSYIEPRQQTVSSTPPKMWYNRHPRKSQSAARTSSRTMSLPSTVSLDFEEISPVQLDNTGINALRLRRRPLTANVIHYPITGKMSKNFPTVKSLSEHTTPTKMSKSEKQYHYEGGLFKRFNKNKQRDFVINPEWVSESLSVEKLKLNERTRNYPIIDMRYATYPTRRCQSAPPPRHRNPITWE